MKTGIKICDAMTCMPISVSSLTTLKECANVMEKHHVGSLLIIDDKKLLGLVSEKDIVRKAVGKISNPERLLAKDIMESHLHTIRPEEDIADALTMMNDYNIRHLPVMDDNKLIGLITAKDILKIQPHLFETLAETIELREQESKLKNFCQACGKFNTDLVNQDGIMICSKCNN